MRKRTKFLFLRTSVIFAFVLLAGRLWYVQVVMGSYYKAQGDTSKIRTIPVQANRGIVYDSKGRQLVWNAPSWDIGIVPHGVPTGHTTQIYTLLSHLLGGKPTPGGIRQLVAQGRFRPYTAQTIKTRVTNDTALVVMQYHNRLPGVRVEMGTVRHYHMDPTLYSLSHIMGYASQIDGPTYQQYKRLYPQQHVGLNDVVGKTGVELQYDSYLHGINGSQQVEVDAGERPVRTLRTGGDIPGDSVYLTIDSKFQHQVASDLKQALDRYQLHQGVAVVEDVNTGAILAMVSLPSFNSNWFSGGISQTRYNSLNNDPSHPLNDLSIGGQYPPGSTFKLVTAGAALGSGVVTPNTTYDDTGQINLPGGQVYAGWKAGGLGSVNVVSAIQLSSDIYFYTVAGGDPNLHPDPPHTGSNVLARYARLYGLGQQTGIDLPYESPGFVPSARWFNALRPTPYLKHAGDIWTIGYTYNMAIGQGQDLATPLQVANYTAMVANGGTLYRPRIVQRIVGRVLPGKSVFHKPRVIQPFVPSILRRNFISSYYLGLIRHGMYLGSHTGITGTSYAVYDPRIAIAGKTGTAEVLGKVPHAWWTGFAPYNNPKIAVTVLVPNANAEGAMFSAPIAHKIFEDYFGYKPLRNLVGEDGVGISTDGRNGGWLYDVQQSLVGTGAGSQ